MEYTRMSTKDMLQYCEEALAWEEFGPVDIFFFESVKRILLGQCSAVEIPEQDELAGVSVPMGIRELIEYDKGSEELTEAIEGDSFFESGETFELPDGKEA